MKNAMKTILLLLALLLLVSCQNENDIYLGDNPHAALIIANRGDKSFNDSAIVAFTRVKNDFDINISILEHENDKANSEGRFFEAVENNNRLVVADAIMTPVYEKYLDDYPNIKFILFDDQVDWSSYDFDNLSCLVYESNESSYLAGYIAASLSKSGSIGFIGGIDRSINNNFLVGYIEGAKRYNPNIKVHVEYSQAYDNPEIGRQISKDMIDDGVDIIFGAAGMTNHGIFEMADEHDIYAIGVDTDQALLYKGEGETDIADNIVTSVTKNISQTIYDDIENFVNFEFEKGTKELGLKESGVGIAKNEYYDDIVDEEVKKEIESIEEEIISGQLIVPSTLDMDEEEFENIVESVRP